MSRYARTAGVRAMAACGVIAMLATGAWAALPGGVGGRVRNINAALEQAEKALEADHLATAQRKLKDVDRFLKEIKDRDADKFDEADPDYKAMIDRVAAVTAKVRAAEKSAAGAAAADRDASEAREALCNAWIEKLRPFVDRKSDQYLRTGSELNTASAEDQARSRAAYARAKALFAEYQKIEFPGGKTAELANLEGQVTGSMNYLGRDEADSAQEAACKEWVDKLAPYVEVGMGSPKLLIAAPTADAEQIKTQQGLYEEAGKLFAEYLKAPFPAGKTGRLQAIEEEMKRTLEEFPKAMAASQAMISGDVGKRLDGVLAYLNEDTGWQSDPAKPPPTITGRSLAALREEVARYAGTVKADDPKLVAVKALLKDAEEKDAEHRVAWAQRTFQKPDGYSGKDLGALKDEAKAVAEAAHPKGTALRVTVPSADWAVEDVIEATDTTQTALRHRITRSVRAQVAVKDADGTVWLQEVYLGQDKKPDGGWGELKGHTTWADQMAAGNVGKPAVP